MWSPRSGCGGLGSRLLSLRKRAEVRVTQFENGGLRVSIPGSRGPGLLGLGKEGLVLDSYV